jgi:hypothetical protein
MREIGARAASFDKVGRLHALRSVPDLAQTIRSVFNGRILLHRFLNFATRLRLATRYKLSVLVIHAVGEVDMRPSLPVHFR